jgi:diaminopimelate epimerase
MLISFYKYQGTGNDFVMLDNFSGEYNALALEQIQTICNRKFGVGADGLIKLNAHPTLDFEMDYYNADGSKSFCGNGARCSVAFASFLGKIENETRFLAIDGEHQALLDKDRISLKMNDVNAITSLGNDFMLHTGSPHYIHLVSNNEEFDIVAFGKKIRYSEAFKEAGINVNSVERLTDFALDVRTYERGVEDETLSCGTGVTAAALAHAFELNLTGKQTVDIQTLGGKLAVSFELQNEMNFTNIHLIGPAIQVFKGEIHV